MIAARMNSSLVLIYLSLSGKFVCRNIETEFEGTLKRKGEVERIKNQFYGDVKFTSPVKYVLRKK